MAQLPFHDKVPAKIRTNELQRTAPLLTRSADLDQIVFLPRKQHNQFINIEPLLGEIDISDIDFMDWIIIGAETSNRWDKVKPKREWIETIITAARAAEIPVFMNSSRRQTQQLNNFCV